MLVNTSPVSSRDMSWPRHVDGSGWSRTTYVKRIVDHEYGVVCYLVSPIDQSPSISCVNVRGQPE